MDTYIEQALRTNKAGAMHTELVPLDMLRGELGVFVDDTGFLDDMKKGLFYGKDTPDLKESRHHYVVQDLDWERVEVTRDTIHGILGIITEARELAELLIDAIDHEQDVSTEAIIDEAGDSLWYHAVLFNDQRVSFSGVMAANIAKLNGYEIVQDIAAKLAERERQP